MTPIASFSPGNRGLLPFGTCRLGGPPHSSLIGTDSCVDVRLGQGSVVGVTDLEFLGAEPVLCTVLQVYIGALSWDASFFIRPLPDLLGSHCAEMIETHGLGATHRDRCKSSSPLEPEHWVCASDSGGPPCRFQGTGLRMTARLAPPQSIFTRSWLPSHPVEVWEAIGRFEGLFWPSGFKHCNGGLRCTSVAQGCTPIACKPCKLTEVSVTNLSWDLLSLRALLICVVFGAGIALAARCSAIILEVSLTWFGRSIRPAWATRAPNNGPDTSWRIFGFILGFATVLTRLHLTVVGAHSIMTCQRRLLSDLETYVVSLSLTLGLVVLGQLLALLMRALGFHRTPGGRCILWCDTSHVALILCSLAAASCVDSSPLLWRVCISDAACLGRYRRQRRHATGAQSSSYSVLWRPVPAATSLAGFTRGTPHYNRHDPGVALPEALGPGLGARRLPSQHWTCKCFRGFVSRDALAEGCHDPTSAFPDAAAAPAPNNTEIEAVASRGIVPCVPCLVHKLDQEPASLTLEGRTTLERLRDMPGPAAGTWPTVPATDDFALQRAVPSRRRPLLRSCVPRWRCTVILFRGESFLSCAQWSHNPLTPTAFFSHSRGGRHPSMWLVLTSLRLTAGSMRRMCHLSPPDAHCCALRHSRRTVQLISTSAVARFPLRPRESSTCSSGLACSLSPVLNCPDPISGCRTRCSLLSAGCRRSCFHLGQNSRVPV